MSIEKRLTILNQLYTLFEEEGQVVPKACEKGCAVCCTTNTTLTTLEGYNIAINMVQHQKGHLFDAIREDTGRTVYKPQTTLNEIAQKEEDALEAESDEMASEATCPALENEVCPIYLVRPLACRGMVSKTRCQPGGFAEMNEITVVLHNLFAQYVEHLDAGGYTGNFSDVMLFMASAENRATYAAGGLAEVPAGMIPNHPLKTLMIPEEFRERVLPLLKKIGQMG